MRIAWTRGLRVVTAGLCAALALVARPGSVAGQDAAVAPSAETQALLSEALAEYDRGNYAEAYALFSRLHAIHPTARTERALGNTCFELRRYVEAVGWLELSLADERNPLTPEMRTEAEGLLARARSFVGEYAITTSVPGATIEVDGAPLGADAIQLDVGDHVVVASAPGYTTVTRRVAVRGGEVEELALVLRPVTAAEPAEASAASSTGIERASAVEDDVTAPADGGGGEDPLESWWFWTIVGLVVSGAGVGIGTGVAFGSTTAVEAPIVPVGGLVMALEGP